VVEAARLARTNEVKIKNILVLRRTATLSKEGAREV
jgi:hypothetical protein